FRLRQVFGAELEEGEGAVFRSAPFDLVGLEIGGEIGVVRLTDIAGDRRGEGDVVDAALFRAVFVQGAQIGFRRADAADERVRDLIAQVDGVALAHILVFAETVALQDAAEIGTVEAAIWPDKGRVLGDLAGEGVARQAEAVTARRVVKRCLRYQAAEYLSGQAEELRLLARHRPVHLAAEILHGNVILSGEVGGGNLRLADGRDRVGAEAGKD